MKSNQIKLGCDPVEVKSCLILVFILGGNYLKLKAFGGQNKTLVTDLADWPTGQIVDFEGGGGVDNQKINPPKLSWLS